MKGISRIDSRQTHGWFVRVYRDGKTHSKMFSDGVHGDREKALEIARKYKDEYEEKHPPSLINQRLRLKPLKNNKTGIPGISETFGRAQGNRGKKMPCFCVSWVPTPYKPRSKKFFFSKYGNRESAFEASVEFRKEKEQEIIKALNGGNSFHKEQIDPLSQMLSNLKSKPFR